MIIVRVVIVKKGRYNGTADPLHNIMLLENAQQHTKKAAGKIREHRGRVDSHMAGFSLFMEFVNSEITEYQLPYPLQNNNQKCMLHGENGEMFDQM